MAGMMNFGGGNGWVSGGGRGDKGNCVRGVGGRRKGSVFGVGGKVWM